MTLLDCLSTIRQAGGMVWVNDQTVRYRAPAGVITPAIKSVLAESKSLLIDLLQGSPQEPEGELQRYESLTHDQQERHLQQGRGEWQAIVAGDLRTNELIQALHPSEQTNKTNNTNKFETRPGISSLVRIETVAETKWHGKHFTYTYPPGTSGWLVQDPESEIDDDHIRLLIQDALRAKARAGNPHLAVWLCGSPRILPQSYVRVLG